jgi:hypothetical protein
MNSLREIAKFASGAETFHAFIHFVLWFSGTTLTVLGFMETPTVHMWGAIGNAVIALALGVFAWRGTQLPIGSAHRPSVPTHSSR